jgi:hypothetical protein
MKKCIAIFAIILLIGAVFTPREEKNADEK